MWNNEEHLELYLAVPSMGAVLHTINIRLFPQQMIYVVNHAEDYVVAVDNTIAEPFSKLLPHMPTVKHVIVNGPVPDEVRAALAGDGAREVHDYRTLLDAESDEFAWPELDENDAAAMCYTSGTTGNPKGVVYSHRSNYLHCLQLGMNLGLSLQRGRQGPGHRAAVPRELVGPAVRRAGDRREHGDARPVPPGAAAGDDDRDAGDQQGGRRPHDLERPAPPPRREPRRSENGVDISSLEQAIVGGSACPPSLMRAFEERYGVRVLHAWGMTEMSPLGTVAVPPRAAEGDEAWAYRVTQGRLALPVEAGSSGRTARSSPWDGEGVGELEVRGPWITGVLLQATTTRRSSDDGWLRTGDVGTLSTGRLPPAHRPRQGRHQVRRRVDQLGGAGERAHGPPEGRRGERRRRPGREVGRAAAGDRRPQRGRDRRHRGAARRSSPRRSPSGRCPSGGRSSPRCRRPASASSTRRCCAPGTPRASWTS